MTQEDKLLLFKDLCTRLSYGVNVLINIEHLDIKGIGNLNKISTYNLLVDVENFEPFKENKGRLIDFGGKRPLTINEIKPYLRPMSSMTEEEECELCHLFECDSVNTMYGHINWVVGGSCDYDDFNIEFSKLAKVIDWLNKKMFDYRGLILIGLALEAPKGMYETE